MGRYVAKNHCRQAEGDAATFTIERNRSTKRSSGYEVTRQVHLKPGCTQFNEGLLIFLLKWPDAQLYFCFSEKVILITGYRKTCYYTVVSWDSTIHSFAVMNHTDSFAVTIDIANVQNFWSRLVTESNDKLTKFAGKVWMSTSQRYNTKYLPWLAFLSGHTYIHINISQSTHGAPFPPWLIVALRRGWKINLQLYDFSYAAENKVLYKELSIIR